MDWISRVLGGTDPTLPGPGMPADSGSLSGGSSASLVDSDELAAELARARRYEHDLAVAVLWTQASHEIGGRARGRSRETRLPQMLSLLVAVALRDVLRQSDIICYHAAENRFVIGLAETDAEEAEEAFQRVRDHFHDRLSTQVVTGIASFPDDALTLEELIAAAETRALLGGSSAHVPPNGNGTSSGARHDSDTTVGPDEDRRRRLSP